MKHESDGNTNCNWYTRYSYQMFDTRTGRFGNNRRSRDYPHKSIVEIGQNSEKSLGELRKLAVIQTPVIKPLAYADVKISKKRKRMNYN